ncbi:MAG: class I SAM-dependent methyltransferase [Thermoplasmata archaeon]|nr:class I SAM-dependent methyltransferase [Thermoplasmata archaeon]
MSTKERLEKYLDLAIQEGSYSTKDNLRFRLEYLFKDVPIRDRSMLDIGGGAGLASFYAASMGATDVLCLEPEARGSSEGVALKFERLQEGMRERGEERGRTDGGQEEAKVQLLPDTIQDLDLGKRKFDIIFLGNSINHLDEEACMRLGEDDEAVERYAAIFRKLGGLANEGADIIITDCSRHNFFGMLHVKNPFAPMIDWKVHRSPRFWAKLLADAGFCSPRIRWTSFNRLGRGGRILFGNAAAAFFLQSHFCLNMKRTP